MANYLSSPTVISLSTVLIIYLWMNQGVLYVSIQKKWRLLALECKFRLSTSQPDIQIKSREICTWKVVLCRHSSLDSRLPFCLSVSPPLVLCQPPPHPSHQTRVEGGFLLSFLPPTNAPSPSTRPPPCAAPRSCIPASASTPPACALRQRPLPLRHAPRLRRRPRSVRCVNAPAPVLPPLRRHRPCALHRRPGPCVSATCAVPSSASVHPPPCVHCAATLLHAASPVLHPLYTVSPSLSSPAPSFSILHQWCPSLSTPCTLHHWHATTATNSPSMRCCCQCCLLSGSKHERRGFPWAFPLL
jgi:hypothetical protein